MIVIGIDPGLDGAVAVLDGTNAVAFRTPAFRVTGGSRNRREYDVSEMRSLLLSIQSRFDPAVTAYLELVHSMPRQGVASSFCFGRGLGLWEGLLSGLSIPCQKVTPQRWKKELLDGQPKGKGASIMVAKQLFPSVSMDRAKDHGIADALLIAEYGRRMAGR